MSPVRYLKVEEVAEKLRINKRTLENILKDKNKGFPKPIPLTTKRVWIESDIDEFMKNMVR